MDNRLNEYTDPKKWLDINSDASLLSDKEKDLLKQALNKDWATPRFKMRWFQGQAQLTKWAIFRQWMLELRSSEEGIENVEYEIEKGKADILMHQYVAENSKNPGEVKRAEVEVKYLTRQVARSTRILNDFLMSRHYYLDLLKEFLNSPDGKIPDGTDRSWLDILHSDEQDQYEKQIWTNRLGKQAALDIMFYGRIGVGNMDAILQLSPDQQTETLVLATDYALHLQEYQKQLQLDSINKATSGIPLDKKELQFPEIPQHLIEQFKNSKIENKQQSLGNEGDDLDVYNS